MSVLCATSADVIVVCFFFFQAEDGIRDRTVTGVQTCALPIYHRGDYRRGDPGLFGFLGGLSKKALGFVPGIGPIAAAVGGAAVPALLHKREQQIATGQLEPNWLGRHVLPHLTSTQPIGSSMAGTPHGRITRGSGGPGMAV